MPRFTRIAAAVRGLAMRVHHRTDRMPRLPFLIALGVSVVLLVVAIDAARGVDERVTEVDELSLPDADEVQTIESTPAEGVELELVEAGFGAITAPRGGRRISFGAVLRNPGGLEVYVESVQVTGLDSSGEPGRFEEFSLGTIAPETEVMLASVLTTRPEDVDLASLELEIGDLSAWEITSEMEELYGPSYPTVPPEITLLGIEPLIAPEGHRANYEITVEHEFPQADVSVLFRDEEGRIVGGLPASGSPYRYVDDWPESQRFPPGTSVQHVDLPAGIVPPEADLSRTEIGIGL